MTKKILTYSVAIATLVWSVGLFSMPLAVGAATSGDLIKLQCATGAGVNDSCKSVYYLSTNGKRYVFPDQKTYNTWYSDFSGVKIVSSTEMSSYPLGGLVTYKPGSFLVKYTTDPKVYAVSTNGTLRWVKSGDAAAALYGANWAKTSVKDLLDVTVSSYTNGTDISTASDYDKAALLAAVAYISSDKGL